jgi:superfamily I DNA/RNA helicase
VTPKLGLKDIAGTQFASIKSFLSNLDVVENELLSIDSLDDPFGGLVARFYELLDQYRLLTYGRLIARTVDELSKPEIRRKAHETLRYLIVDEYQDVNPAQEKLMGIPAERAWALPYRLRERLGFLSARELAANVDAVLAAVQREPKLHRFVNTIPD